MICFHDGETSCELLYIHCLHLLLTLLSYCLSRCSLFSFFLLSFSFELIYPIDFEALSKHDFASTRFAQILRPISIQTLDSPSQLDPPPCSILPTGGLDSLCTTIGCALALVFDLASWMLPFCHPSQDASCERTTILHPPPLSILNVF